MTKKKRILQFLAIICVIALVPILMAGGGGSGSGGGKGGGGGKSGNGGVDPTSWTDAYPYEDWSLYGHLPVSTTCSYFTPYSSGSNTCPNPTPSTTPFGSDEYSCKIVVTNLGIMPGTNTPYNTTRTFCRGSSNANTTIQIPSTESYKITFDFIDKCTDCMSPQMINLPIGVGRRVHWYAEQIYNMGNTSPTILPYFLQLETCN